MAKQVTTGFKGPDVNTSRATGMTIVESYGKETPGQGAAEGGQKMPSLGGGIHNLSHSIDGGSVTSVPTVGRPHRGTAE